MDFRLTHAVHVLERAAPPPAWIIVGALGLVLARAALAGRRRKLPAESARPLGPYRARTGEQPRVPEDQSLPALRHAFAIAVTAHAAAPLVLVAWHHALREPHGLWGLIG